MNNNKPKVQLLPIISLLSASLLSACVIKVDDEETKDDPNAKGIVDQYTLRAFVQNLKGTGMVLQNNGGDNTSPDVNGNVTFATKINDGSNYNVTILTQPTSPAQNCTVKTGTGTGTINGADVSEVRVQCVTTTAVADFNVTGNKPADNASNIAIDDVIEITFSANIDQTTVSQNSIVVSNSQGNVDGSISVSENKLTFTPNNALASLMEYTVSVKAGIEDVNMNALASNKSVKFNTGINTDKWYRISNKQLGPSKSLDTSNPDYNCSIGDTGPYTGEFWRFTASGNGYIMQSRFAGESKGLEGANGVNPCLFTGFNGNGAPFSGQIWNTVAEGGNYFRLQNLNLGSSYSMEASTPPKMSTTTNNDSQLWNLTELGDVAEISLDQAVYDASTQAYQFGTSTLPNIKTANAPADTDWSRWAMLHNGTSFKLFAMKRNTTNTLYQFVYNGSTQKYEWDSAATNSSVMISGIPDDANTSSIAMLHAQGADRLYMLSKSGTAIHQFKFDSTSNTFIYAFNGAIGKVDITGMPGNINWSRWAMTHDGAHYRVYAMENGSNTQLHQAAYNSASGNYEHGFNSNMPTITSIDAATERERFAILHDGSAYRLYMLRR